MSQRVAKIVTIAIMVSTLAVWIAWDIVVAALGIFPATESQILLAAGFFNFAGPAAAGFVLGHLTWPAPEVDHKWWRLGPSIVYFAALFGANFWGMLPEMIPVVPLVLHIPLGRLGWPQSVRLLGKDA